jgi:hypothetical protein
MPMYMLPPPLSKVRPGEKKVRSERGVCLRQDRALGTNSLINPKDGAKKCGPNGECALDTGVPWTRGGTRFLYVYITRYIQGPTVHFMADGARGTQWRKSAAVGRGYGCKFVIEEKEKNQGWQLHHQTYIHID